VTNTIVIFGDSGLGKTTNAAFAAKYEYEATRGKVVRYIASDGGGYLPCLPLVDPAGIVEPFRIVGVKNPLVVFRKLSMGYWPDKLEDGRWVGERLLPPTPETWQHVGAIVIDTITSACEIFMEDLRDKQRSIGQEPVGKFVEEDERFCASAPASYGFVQREMLARIRSFSSLPVHRVLFVAHESKGEEADRRIPIRGPALVGTAATDKIAKEVGDCLHFEAYAEEAETLDRVTNTKVKRTATRIRAFFMSHPDPRIPGVLYKCKPRVPAEMIPELLKRYPGGYFEPTIHSGLDEFLRFEDELLSRSSERERKWKQEIDAKIRNANTK
jgi:hypothetical protein